MFGRMILSDVRRSPGIAATVTLFTTAAALLVALAAIVLVELVGSVDSLMTRTAVPHVLQMHSGELDRERMQRFVESRDDVAQFQILGFHTVDGAEISFDGASLAASVQDNGFVTQSPDFDVLIDLDGEVVEPAAGELWVPLEYLRDGSAEVGDTAVVAGHRMTVAGFIRDGQMNSPLASSKRFLVSPEDLAAIEDHTVLEHLIEFRLTDPAGIGAFTTAYADAGLEANGPTITYGLFRLINALSDGILVGIILLISGLIIAIALLCIRFALLATIENDYREIGVMKAIGMRVADIRKIYLGKYAAIAAIGCAAGYALAFVFADGLTEGIRLYMGTSGSARLGPLLGAVGVLAVFGAILGFVALVLRRFRRIPPVQAIRVGADAGGTHRRPLRLRTNRLLGANAGLGLLDVVARPRIYLTMLVVIVLAAFIMVVPQNVEHTISQREFAGYMGAGVSDMRVDVQQGADSAAVGTEIAREMAEDPAITDQVMLTTRAYTARLTDGSARRITVELGDHRVFPVEYTAGSAPVGPDDIALSRALADELGLAVGDPLAIDRPGEAPLTVSGLYSDVTNGGQTAKAAFADDDAPAMRVVISADLADPANTAAVVGGYAADFPSAKVTDTDSYIALTLGQTIATVSTAALIAVLVAVTTVVLVIVLFMRMLVAKDRGQIATLRSIGFTDRDITVQYLVRSVAVLVVGVAFGTLLANTLGQWMFGAVLSGLGADGLRFSIDVPLTYVVYPLLLLVAAVGATAASTLRAGRSRIAEHIKEQS